ncbi:MAG: sulfotransferase domain-containing protein [Actinomycetota bacterium]
MTVVDSPPVLHPYGGPARPPSGPLAVARARALGGIRSYGMLTAGLRADPDYLIIGTKRGGTTSLAKWLLLHPEIRSLFPARETRKGAYYFDVNYERGHRWYRSHFPTRLSLDARDLARGSGTIVGEATPYYLHHPHAAMRARQLVPNTKVIALLRHPVDRTQGHWAERHRQGVEPLDFEAALEAESARLDGEEAHMIADPSYVSFAHQHYSYLDQSRYARGLGRWLTAFGPRQVLVLRSEDLYAEPMAVYNQVLDFLGVRPWFPEQLKGHNRVWKPTMSDEMRQRLQALLQPDIDATCELLDRDMAWT